MMHERESQLAASGGAAGELSTRLRNALAEDGCEVTPEAVSKYYTMQRLLRVPNIGAKSIKELQYWLIRHGQKGIT